MEVTLDIPFEQLVSIIRQLTPTQKAKLEKELVSDSKPENQEPSSFTKLLLSGPVFSKKQIQDIEDTRKSINEWRIKD